MTQKCLMCGSMNSDGMSSCGKCGGALERVESITATKPGQPWDEVIVKCPNCGHPMEQGTLETGKDSVWITGHGEEYIGVEAFDGHRCPGCGHLSIHR